MEMWESGGFKREWRVFHWNVVYITAKLVPLTLFLPLCICNTDLEFITFWISSSKKFVLSSWFSVITLTEQFDILGNIPAFFFFYREINMLHA